MIIFRNEFKDRHKKDIELLCRMIENHNIELVGIILDRSSKLLCLIKEFFDKEIAFMTIDPSFPRYRIQHMLQNSNVQMVIVEGKYKMQFTSEEIVDIGNDLFVVMMNRKFQEEDVSYKNIAYIIYTSGSTGCPKGIAIKRESFLNFIDGVSEIIDFSSAKRIACLTTAGFDIFLLESLMALNKGMTVVLANEEEQYNPKLMAKLIADNEVDMLQLTPSKMQLLMNYDQKLSCLKNVSEIMIGGEAFPLNMLQALQKSTTAKIYNMYGPTETTIWSTISNLTYKQQVDIGRPIKNTEVYIMDDNLHILSNGKEGEIGIAGKGLARGYIGREELTREKFVCLPQKPEIKVYRTGDRGRYLADGNLEYLGRTDNQVKVRGYRIELEEIEAILNGFKGVIQSVVAVYEAGQNDKILEAFYTSKEHLDVKEIMGYLSSRLPVYMIPAVFKHVKEFIQTPNGKIDRKRVWECIELKNVNDMQDDNALDKLSKIQKRAYDIIMDHLDTESFPHISVDVNFADLAMDSLASIRLIVALEEEFDFEFDDEMLLIKKFPTIMSMLEYVESKMVENRETI